MSGFWISSDSDQEVGPCLVTDGDSIQYAFFNGDVYLGCNFRQKDIIAWYPTSHPEVPGELMTPEQSAILSLDDEISELKRKISRLENRNKANDNKEKKRKILRD